MANVSSLSLKHIKTVKIHSTIINRVIDAQKHGII